MFLSCHPLRNMWPGIGVVLVVGGPIAALAPFDVVFAAVTRGSAPLRVCLFWAVALSGALSGARIGLQIRSPGLKYRALVGLAAAFSIAVAIVLIDFLFRNILRIPPADFIYLDLRARLVYFMLRAFNENVFYRLFLFSVLALCISKILHDTHDRPTTLAIWIAMIAAQVFNIVLNVGIATLPISISTIVYDVFRYIVPGVCWAWLFWRYDFMTAELASVTCHIFLQPALCYLFM
jgi:hypothetical protein